MGEQRKVRKISDMEVNHLYAIEDIKDVTTTFGRRVILNLENDEFCYLPTRVSKAMLKNDEAGLKEFQERLEVANVSIRCLPGRLGRSWPINFLVTLPDDPLDPTDNFETDDDRENKKIN